MLPSCEVCGATTVCLCHSCWLWCGPVLTAQNDIQLRVGMHPGESRVLDMFAPVKQCAQTNNNAGASKNSQLQASHSHTTAYCHAC